ncbi:MAG: hypothetical protein GF349_00975 [Candidatus Magasanikbacteria bacterium]|nr:hypothetical protein [Candidatus Magasanikbacteria bacterium]
MKEPLYSTALKESLNLAWNHKLLWLFGIFATLLGQMGILDILIKTGKAGSTFALYPNWLVLPKFIIKSLIQAINNGSEVLWVICLILIIVGLIIFFVFLAVVSQGAIIHSAAKYIKSRSNKMPDVGQAWHVGVEHFWRLFFINLLKKAIIILMAVMVGWATLSVLNSGQGVDVLVFFAIFLIASFIGFVLSFWSIYAAAYVVVEEFGLWKAIKSSWKLFTDHWLVSIEVALIILALNFILALIVLLGFFVLFFPTLVIWFISVMTVNIVLYNIGMFIGLVLFTGFIILLGSFFTVYTTTVWTYLFMKMHKKGIVSRILHTFYPKMK